MRVFMELCHASVVFCGIPGFFPFVFWWSVKKTGDAPIFEFFLQKKFLK